MLSQEAARAGLAQTLFDRLMGAGLEPMLLDVQYRMHPLISKVPSVLFYGGRVKSGVSAEQRPPVQGIRWPLDGFPVAMVDVDDGVETRDENMSWTNDEVRR